MQPTNLEQGISKLLGQWETRSKEQSKFKPAYIDALRDCMYEVSSLLSQYQSK